MSGVLSLFLGFVLYFGAVFLFYSFLFGVLCLASRRYDCLSFVEDD